MSWPLCPQFSLSQPWGLQRQEKPTLRSMIGLTIAKAALSMETGNATSPWWPSRRPSERQRDVWNATMLPASRVALQPSTSRPSSTISRTKTGTVRPKLSSQTTLSVWLAVNSAPLVSCALATATWVTPSKVLSRLIDFKNLPLEFSKKWASLRLEILHFLRTYLLLIKNPSPSLVLVLLPLVVLPSSEEWVR